MRRVAGLVVGAMWMVTPGVAQAAGYFVSEIGPKAIGRGGAFVANPDDPTALWLNPAGLSGVKGMQVYVDSSWVRLNQQYTRTCEPSCAPTPYQASYDDSVLTVPRHPQDTGDAIYDGFAPDPKHPDSPVMSRVARSTGTVKNASPMFRGDGHVLGGRLIPFLSMTANGELLGIPGLALGAAAYGPNTGGVQYPADGPQRYSIISSVPVEALFELAAAYRFNRYFGLGLGVSLVSLGTHQSLALSTDKQGRETPDKDVLVDVNVTEHFIPALTVGFTSNPIGGLHIGGSFITPRYARHATGPFRVTPTGNLNNTEDPDSLLLTFDDKNAKAVARFGSPAVARFGIQYVYKQYFDVEVAAVREMWSIMRYTRLDIEGLNATSGILPAGSPPLALPPTIQPREWNDTWSLRAGGDLHVVPGIFTVRAGTYIEESAIPERTYDTSVADGRKLGVSTGFSVGYFGFRLVGAWQHIFIEPRTVGHSMQVSQNPLTGVLPGAGGNTSVALGQYYQSHDLMSVGVMMDVGEVALRVKGAVTGDKGWWSPEGTQSRALVNAGDVLQKHSNF